VLVGGWVALLVIVFIYWVCGTLMSFVGRLVEVCCGYLLALLL